MSSEDQIDALLEQLRCEFSLVRDETWHAWLDDLKHRTSAAPDSTTQN